MKRLLSEFLFSNEGVTSIEYSLIASLIFVAIVLAVSSLGVNINDLFQSVATKYP